MTLIQQSLQHFQLQSQQKFLTCQSFQIDTDWKKILVTKNGDKNGDRCRQSDVLKTRLSF